MSNFDTKDNYLIQSILNMKFCKAIKQNQFICVQGNRGHNSCFFKKPIVEGKFYLQIVGYCPKSTLEPYKNAPAIRVGVAPTQYYYNYPLGLDFSIGYRMDGVIVQNGKPVTKIDGFSFGDVVGIGITVNVAFKNRNKTQKVDQSFVEFFKNGNLTGPPLYLLTQDLYTFAVSFYNESYARFNIGQKNIQYLPKGYNPYETHLKNKCQFHDKEIQSIEQELEYCLQINRNQEIKKNDLSK